MNYQDIIKSIKKKEYAPVYFLAGIETYFTDRITAAIENGVLSEAEKSFNQSIFYGKDTEAQTVIATAKRFPMMSSHQVVIVKEAHQMKNLDLLEAYIMEPLASTILVIAYKKKLDGRTSLAKKVKKNAVYLDSKRLYENQVGAFIRNQIVAAGYQADEMAVNLLAEYLGMNLHHIDMQLEKLFINFQPTETIDSAAVSELIGISREFNVFELQKAISYNEKVKVIRIMDYFSKNPKAAPMPLLVSSMYTYYNRLYLMQYAGHLDAKNLAGIMGLGSSFFLKEYRQAAKHISVKKIRRCLQLCLIYDLKSKGYENGGTPNNELMREMLLKMVS